MALAWSPELESMASSMRCDGEACLAEPEEARTRFAGRCLAWVDKLERKKMKFSVHASMMKKLAVAAVLGVEKKNRGEEKEQGRCKIIGVRKM
jgi:hypothetical protein